MMPPLMAFIAVKHSTDVVSRLQIVVEADADCFSPEAAAAHGFALQGDRWVRSLTPTMIDAEIARSQWPRNAGPVVSWRVVKPSAFADDGDGLYKAARRDDGKRLYIDMPAARAIHRDMMRAARKPLFQDLDYQHERAVKQGKASEAGAIEAERQALRDVTIVPDIDAAETPDELKGVWPRSLGAAAF